MLLDRKTLKPLSLEELSSSDKITLVEVIDLSVGEVKAKCREEDVADCLSGLLIVYTKDPSLTGVEVVDVFDLGGEYAVVVRATPESAARLYRNSAVVRVEKSREVRAL